MSFWSSKSGTEITGKPEAAFTPDFTIIPENTIATASVLAWDLVSKDATDYADEDKFYQITWKITAGEFKNRQVTQKIKAFNGSPESIDRNLNMMKLIMDLCSYKPPHGDAPSAQDLAPMVGQILGIRIKEWSIEKRDGSGLIEGNYVAEVYSPVGLQTETGIKKTPPKSTSPVDSAFSRNPRAQEEDFDDGIPF